MFRNYLLPVILIALSFFPAYSQIRLEKGYYIDNSGNRTECYIRDADWNNNPTSFKYKSLSEEFGEATIDDVQEFGMENGAVYVRAKVKLDESAMQLHLLSHQRAPEWTERVIFLKTVVKGPATLYLYRWSGITRFYYLKEAGVLTPLVYKRYLDDNGNVLSNFGFRQELLNALQCGDIGSGWVARLNYTEADMEKAFKKYNACVNPGTAVETASIRREKFHVKVTPGADFIAMKAGTYTRFNDGSKTYNTILPRLGLDFEYVFPFNRNKWTLMAEPSLQYYDTPLNLFGLKLNADYWSVELPVGVRHYFFLKGNTKLFLNALAVPHLTSWQSSASRKERDMEMRSKMGFALGAGIAKGRWSGEVRYVLRRDAFASYVNIDVKHTKVSLLLGYRIFAR